MNTKSPVPDTLPGHPILCPAGCPHEPLTHICSPQNAAQEVALSFLPALTLVKVWELDSLQVSLAQPLFWLSPPWRASPPCPL